MSSSENKPLVSFLVCSFNDDYLEQSVQSILQQSYKHLEVILVNDNPARQLKAEDYADARVKVVNSERNLGVTGAANLGIQHCSGEYIFRQDDDDFSKPMRTEQTLAVFAENPQVQAVCGIAEVEFRSQNKSFVKLYAPPSSITQIHEKLMWSNVIQNSTVAFRSSMLKQLQGYDSKFRFAQDYELLLRLQEQGQVIASTDSILVRRMVDGQNISTKNRKRQLLYAMSAKCRFFACNRISLTTVVSSLGLDMARLLVPASARSLYAKLR